VAKLQSLQNDISTYKRDIADLKLEQATHEEKMLDQSEQLEMVMLDKEVAEERAEGAEADLEFEKEKRAEVEVELEVYKKEREMLSESGAEGAAGVFNVKASMDYIQLEKQNERLKDALGRYVDSISHGHPQISRRYSGCET